MYPAKEFQAMNTFLLVITTVENKDQAQQIALLVTRHRLAACAQIVGPVSSTYWWEDKLETAEEWQLVFKTTQSAYAELENFLKEHHPYKVPEIVALPILSGNSSYLNWVAAEVRPALT
jgi:periplasmic divalent cation tolerance protein